MTDEVRPGLRNVGLVTAAVWADVDGDGRPDLLVATEWGPINYFHNTGNGLENWTEKAGLAERTGWWSALAVADLNGDGSLDIIAGNIGLNTKYHATAAEPTVLFAGDLDDSGNSSWSRRSTRTASSTRSAAAASWPTPTRGSRRSSRPTPPIRRPRSRTSSAPTTSRRPSATRPTELASGVYFQKRD